MIKMAITRHLIFSTIKTDPKHMAQIANLAQRLTDKFTHPDEEPYEIDLYPLNSFTLGVTWLGDHTYSKYFEQELCTQFNIKSCTHEFYNFDEFEFDLDLDRDLSPTESEQEDALDIIFNLK